MKRWIKSAIAMFLLSASAVAVGVGDAAPDFTLNTLDGGQFTLSDNLGKVVYLYFIGYG